MNEHELERLMVEIHDYLKRNQENSTKGIIDKWIRPVLIAIMIALITAFATSYKNLLSMERSIDVIKREIRQIKQDVNFNFSIIENRLDNQIKLKKLDDSHNNDGGGK